MYKRQLSPNGKYLLTRYSDNYDVKRSRTRCELTEVKTSLEFATDTVIEPYNPADSLHEKLRAVAQQKKADVYKRQG